jgi:hypothetical protein
MTSANTTGGFTISFDPSPRTTKSVYIGIDLHSVGVGYHVHLPTRCVVLFKSGGDLHV